MEGRPVRKHRMRLLGAFAAAVVATTGLLLPATPASADIIGGLLGGDGLLGGLLSVGGSGSFDWGTTSTNPISTTQVAQGIGASSTAAAGLTGSGRGVAVIGTGAGPVPGLPAAQNG